MPDPLNTHVVLGFTGTRKGWTDNQRRNMHAWFERNAAMVVEAHHGDCVGSDAEFHVLCGRYEIPVVVHPPDNDKLRAFCEGAESRWPLPYLERDRNIVNACDMLLATPATLTERDRSGTWYTVRQARKHDKEVIIYGP